MYCTTCGQVAGSLRGLKYCSAGIFLAAPLPPVTFPVPNRPVEKSVKYGATILPLDRADGLLSVCFRRGGLPVRVIRSKRDWLPSCCQWRGLAADVAVSSAIFWP